MKEHSFYRSGSAFRKILAVVLFLVFPVTSAHSATYYVSKTGNDTNPGTKAKPWGTIRKAATTLIAGDTVYIKAGTYKEIVVPLRSGSPDKYITYAAFPGSKVTIDGKGKRLAFDFGVFDMSGKDYIKVSGLRVINSSQTGIVADRSTGIIIEKCSTFNTAQSGIAAWACKNLIINGNEVNRACTGKWHECISVGGTDTFEIKNNYVHHAGNPGKEGIDVEGGSSNGKVYGNLVHDTMLGIYVDAWNKHAYNIEVYGNITHDNKGDGIALASEQGGLLENIKVYNNISYNNGWSGIDISGCCVSTHPMKGITVINNTFYNNGNQDWGNGLYIDNPQIADFIFRNNICSKNTTSQISLDFSVSPEVLTIDHNLIDGDSDHYGSDYVLEDPAFVDPDAADFHLREGSPAIDAGSSDNAPDNDFEGNPRPKGSGYDIGAFEF